MKRISGCEQRQAREKTVDERNLQLVSIRDLDAQQVRVLDVEPTARADLSALRVQPIVRQLADAIDIGGEIFERFMRGIENADARIREQFALDTRHSLGRALQ